MVTQKIDSVTPIRKNEIKFAKDEEVYILLPASQIGERTDKFVKHIFSMKCGCNLYFKREAKSGDMITESFRVIDYEYNLVKIYTKEQYKAYKRDKLLREIEALEKEKLLKEIENGKKKNCNKDDCTV